MLAGIVTCTELIVMITLIAMPIPWLIGFYIMFLSTRFFRHGSHVLDYQCSGLSFGTDAPPGEYLSIYMFGIMLDPVLIHIEAISSCCWPACCCWAGWTRGHSAMMDLKLIEEGCKIKL